MYKISLYFLFLLMLFISILNNTNWAFNVSWTQIQVSGNETLASFATWANSNTGATFYDNNAVEANYQLKIQNWAVFDTSSWVLIINNRVEGQSNNATDSWVWKSHWWSVIVQGNLNQYAEWWAPMDFDRSHWVINKTGGVQSFFRSESSATPTKVLNSTYIQNSGNIDGHLQFSWWTWIVRNTYFENKSGGQPFLLIRDSDSDWVSLIGIDLWWWNTLTQPTTIHKNMTFDHWSWADARNIIFYYRRANNPIFYNAVNQADGQRLTTISYKALGSGGGTGRSVIVGKFEPVIQNENSVLQNWVNIQIKKLSDNTIEQTGTTGTNWKVNVTWSTHSVSWQSRNIDEQWVLYVKQSITPTTAGAVNSVDQWNFRIRMRKPDLQLFESTQSFVNDFDGVKLIQTDPHFTVTPAQASAISGITINSANSTITVASGSVVTMQDIYNYSKHWLSLSSNLDVDNFIVANWTSQLKSFELSYRLIINGTVNINPASQKLIIPSNAAANSIQVNSWGILNLGIAWNVQTILTALEINKNWPACCTNWWLDIQNGWTLNWINSKYFTKSVTEFQAWSNINITNAIIQWDLTWLRVRSSTNNLNINGLVADNVQFDILSSTPTSFNWFSWNNTGWIPLEIALWTWEKVLKNYGAWATSSAGINTWDNQNVKVLNNTQWSAMIIVPDGWGRLWWRLYKQWSLKIKDLLNNNLSWVRWFIKDSNNWNRQTAAIFWQDFRADQVYTWSTNVSWETWTKELLTAFYYRNNTTWDIAAPDWNEIIDRRGNNNSTDDKFSINLLSYNHEYQSIPDVEMKWLDIKELNTVLFPDNLITQSNKAIVDNYTSISNLDQLYDRAKSWKVDNLSLSYPSVSSLLISASWKELDLWNLNLVVDPNASSVFSLNTLTNTLTIKSNLLQEWNKFNSITTSWSISVVNWWFIDIIYSDMNSNSSVLITTPFPWQIVKVFSNLSNLNSNTNPISTLVSNASKNLIYRYNSWTWAIYFKTDISSTIPKWSMKKYTLASWVDNSLNLSSWWDFNYVNAQLNQIKWFWFDSNLHSLKSSYNSGSLTLSQLDKDSIASITKSKIEEPSWLLQKIHDILLDILTRVISVKWDTQNIN